MALEPEHPTETPVDTPVEPTSEPTTAPSTDLDPLQRAIGAARRTEPSWVEVSTQVLHRVRALVTPSEPVVVHGADGSMDADDDGSRTYLATRVLVAALRRLLQSQPTHAPEAIELTVRDARLVEVEVRLVAAYGTPLRDLADTVRADVLAALRELLGPDPDLGPAAVAVGFTDVVDGDPRQV